MGVAQGPDIGDISIHALLAESDVKADTGKHLKVVFLSTLSLRRATENGFAGVLFLIDISIHALLAESDLFSFVSDSLPALFLSTLSLRRATLDGRFKL